MGAGDEGDLAVHIPYFLILAMPGATITIGFRLFVDFRVFEPITFGGKNNLTVRTTELVNFVLIIRIFYIKLFTPTLRAFYFSHTQSPYIGLNPF
jgi:hypothetical protein